MIVGDLNRVKELLSHDYEEHRTKWIIRILNKNRATIRRADLQKTSK